MLAETDTPRPEAVVNNLERAFPFERFDSFFTIVYITIDYAKGCLFYSSAGHPPLILIGQNGSLRMLDVHGPVIGTGSVHSYPSQKVQLKSGDKVILYTDGILDYSNAMGEFYGKERLLKILGQFADSPVQILMDMVQESVESFAGGDKS
jgi:sigma-B regulation protein RsbU (phosphoserine phosphatase)